MTHDFSHDPVKLRIVDIKSGIWKQTYVFVGVVPSDVESQLHKLEKNINQTVNPTLRKFYGPNWRVKLGVDVLSNKRSETKKGGNVQTEGGAEFEIDENLLADLEEITIKKPLNKLTTKIDISNNSYVNTTDNTNKTSTSETPNNSAVDLDADASTDVISDASTDNTDEPPEEIPDVIDEADHLLEAEDLDLNDQVDFLAEKETTMDIIYAGGVKFITEIDVNPTDNIFEFKNKIYTTIGIPIYRQHLWFKYRDRSYPMNYTISINKHIENIDIERLIAFYKNPKETNGISDIDGMPIEINYYNNKDFMTISARDTFELLRNVYYKYATNEFFLTDLNDMIKPSDIYSRLHSDKYQLDLIYYGFIIIYFPMITHSVFLEYIRNEKALYEMYPDLLPDKNKLHNNFVIESEITSEAYELLEDNEIDEKLFSSITATTVSIDNYNQDVDVVLSLRNLFDVIELNDTITYCKANIIHENANVILRKAYMLEREPKDIIPVGSVLIKIKINADTNENMRLIMFKNGNYVIKTDWREENHMDFARVVKTVSDKINPIIRMINKYGESIKYHRILLEEIGKHNAVFTETSMSFYYDDDTTEARFAMFKNVLEDFRRVGIITSKENVSVGFEYFFNKGMYKYDPSRIEKSISVDNYYEFLSNAVVKQKWETVFIRTRLFQVLNVSSKLKITISGIRNDIEMEIFHMYLKALLSIYIRSAKHIKVVSSETFQTKTKKVLKNLKVQDPLLYDFKKIYKGTVIYSKICQKPYQPIILNDDEYDKLPKDKKANALRYWNFTKQKPVWYSCPNPKYPYVKFIVKQHPKDFCIPCCKKIQMNENVNEKKQEIHNLCLTAHEYTGEKINLTKGSHYIASYGKNIEPGRISRLPENTLEPMFFDTYSAEGGIDAECMTTDGYYLYGIDQNTIHVDDIGMLHCLANALSMTTGDFISEVILRLKKNTENFRVLLDGNASLYFVDIQNICDDLRDLNDEESIDTSDKNHIPWNALLISIAYYYFGINTLIFEDLQKEMINMILPKGLKTHSEMFPNSHKNLVVLKKKTKYYPIYLFNTEIFKRTGIIDTKLFLNESGLITIIKSIVKRTFETQEFDKIKSVIDLTTVKNFCASIDGEIAHYYINYSNLCYAVVINYKKSLIYFPITSSHYPLEKDISLILTPYKGEYNAHHDDLFKLLIAFKRWNLEQSRKAGLDGNVLLYPQIEVYQWLKYNNKVIGFIFNNCYYYIKEISEETAKRIISKPIQTTFYHPFEINELIYDVKQGTKRIEQLPEHNTKLNKQLLNYYLYNILLMHFVNVFNSQKNTTLRAKLVSTLSKTNFNKNLDKIREIIDNFEDEEDRHKITAIIGRYLSNHHDKKTMLSDIAATYFNFDKIALEKMRNKSVPEINKELHKIAAGFVKFGTAKITKFPNMFVACNGGEYCSGTKLIIEKERLNELIGIIATEVANPGKWRWLFNSVFITRTVNFFKFIKRKNETITVEILTA